MGPHTPEAGWEDVTASLMSSDGFAKRGSDTAVNGGLGANESDRFRFNTTIFLLP